MLRIERALKTKPLYAALGVPEDATDEQIRAAFMRIAKANHPDLNGGEVNETYAAAAHAYEVLKDKDLRAKYDADGIDPTAEQGLQLVALEVIKARALACINDLDVTDLVGRIRMALERDHAQARTESLRVGRVIEKAEKARAAIETNWKGASGPKEAILAMMETKIEKDRATKAEQDHNLEVLALAFKMLESASWEGPKVSSSSLSNFSIDYRSQWIVR